MSTRDLKKIMDSGWAEALEPVAPQIAAMGDFLRQDVSEGRTYLPSGDNVLRAFQQPFDDVRVLIVRQDPYPTAGDAVGLSLAVARDGRLAGSLRDHLQGMQDAVGTPMPSGGDLAPWTQRGVLLLNRVLTVAPGEPGSHRAKGWETVRDRA